MNDPKIGTHAPSPAGAHRVAASTRQVRCAVVTVSDTRTPETDTGGRLLRTLLSDAGHAVTTHTMVPDSHDAITLALDAALARDDVDALLLTGGTGVSPRDITPDAVRPRLVADLPGFGELFRSLSFAEIGPAAMLSRAAAGVAGGRDGRRRLVVTLPGSPHAIELAMRRLLLPELGHLMAEITGTPA